MKYKDLQIKLDLLRNQLSAQGLLNRDSIYSDAFLEEINKADLMITIHDVELYRPICINNKMAEFYGLDKNWLKGMDYLYYINNIHISAYFTLIESISFFKKDIEEFLNLEYKLLYQNREWKQVVGTTKTIVRDEKGKPKYAITVAVLNGKDSAEITENPFKSLSKREKQIAVLLCHGLSKKKIADSIFIAESTVETHTRTIYKKIGVNKISELIALTVKYPLEMDEIIKN